MKYQVINSMNLEDLVKTVNAALGDGWLPAAGFWAGPRGFYQPMVKGPETALGPKRAA